MVGCILQRAHDAHEQRHVEHGAYLALPICSFSCITGLYWDPRNGGLGLHSLARAPPILPMGIFDFPWRPMEGSQERGVF